MQPNKNWQASHTMQIRFPESKTRVHPKDMSSTSLSSVDLIMIIYNEQKWNNYGTLSGKLDRVAYRRRRML